MAGEGVRRLHKSRYGSISTYIYHCRGDTLCHRTFAEYNDIPCPVDEEVRGVVEVVVMVGGSTRMPNVQRAVGELFGTVSPQGKRVIDMANFEKWVPNSSDKLVGEFL